jgi:drug/metabolite transporter (DMT)-like permease
MSIEAALTLRNTQLKNRIFIALVVLSNSVGNLLLGFAMERMPDFSKTTLLTYTFAVGTNIWLLLGMALMIVYMIAQLSMFSWADLSYVLPVTASTYIVSALLSKFFLHETVSTVRWLGIALISFGVIFVAETPIREEEGETESVPG